MREESINYILESNKLRGPTPRCD